MIHCVVTSFPREPDYLPRTLESLSAAGFNPHVHHGALGIVPDWLEAARDALDTGADAILLSQDDVVYCRGVAMLLERILWPSENVGCISLYSSSKRQTGTGLHMRQPQRNIWGSCSLLFPVDALRRIITCRIATGWTLTRKLDLLVGRSLMLLGLELWSFSPSLAQHIGGVSTQPKHGAASGYRASGDFLGEAFDASGYLTRLA